jgi:hypothetical protein
MDVPNHVTDATKREKLPAVLGSINLGNLKVYKSARQEYSNACENAIRILIVVKV